MTLALDTAAADTDVAAVLDTDADIAEAGCGDSLATAKTLSDAVVAVIADPSEATLAGARVAWKAARVPCQQTEVLRFGNPFVDAWHGKVNSGPLDDGLIDQTRIIERVVVALNLGGIAVEGSDSLAGPGALFEQRHEPGT